MEIPGKQWAQVIETPGSSVIYKQIPVRQPGPDEVLVNIKYSGVYHTDRHAMKGDWSLKSKWPLVGGHEGAGIVVAKGESVTDIDIGDHASSDEPLCAKALLSGYTIDGTFQQYCVAKAMHSKIPKDAPLDAIAPILCPGITVYNGLEESGTRPGQTVAIVGAGGGLGSLAQQYAKAMGLRVVAIDSGDEKEKAMCQQLGAEVFIDFLTRKYLVSDVRAATTGNLGPHTALLLAASELPCQQAASYVRPRGTIVAIGIPAHAYLKAPVFSTVVRMITIKRSYVGNRQDGYEAIEFFTRGLIHAPFQRIPLSDLGKMYELMGKPCFPFPSQFYANMLAVATCAMNTQLYNKGLSV